MYWVCIVLMVCNSLYTAISLAFMRALPNLGTAIARIIRMIAITIRSSISEKPAARRLRSCSMTSIMTRNSLLAWKLAWKVVCHCDRAQHPRARAELGWDQIGRLHVAVQ